MKNCSLFLLNPFTLQLPLTGVFSLGIKDLNLTLNAKSLQWYILFGEDVLLFLVLFLSSIFERGR